TMTKLRRTVRLLADDLGRRPTLKEIAARAELSEERVILTVGAFQDLLSLDSKLTEDSDTELKDMVEDASGEKPDHLAEKVLVNRQVLGILSFLNTREQDVIKLRFGLLDGQPLNLKEVGLILGLSRERVRQIEHRALRKLEKQQSARDLLDDLNE